MTKTLPEIYIHEETIIDSVTNQSTKTTNVKAETSKKAYELYLKLKND